MDLGDWINRCLCHGMQQQGKAASDSIEQCGIPVEDLQMQWASQKEAQLSIRAHNCSIYLVTIGLIIYQMLPCAWRRSLILFCHSRQTSIMPIERSKPQRLQWRNRIFPTIHWGPWRVWSILMIDWCPRWTYFMHCSMWAISSPSFRISTVTILFLGSALFLISSFRATSPFPGSLSYAYHHYLLIMGPLTFTVHAL